MGNAPVGLLIVGHGTRNRIGQQQFLSLVERVAARLKPVAVEAGFLELAEPTIDEAVGRLVQKGIGRLVTLPLLLFAAGHAKEDIPRMVQEALGRHGRAELPQVQAGHLGCHPLVLELSQRRLLEAEGAAAGGDTVLLLVGRGSRDESATAEMLRFARLREEQSGLAVEVAFLAMARPLLREQLERIAARRPGNVVVQPHLLFHGDLDASLREQVDAARGLGGGTSWRVTPLLADEAGREGDGTEWLLETIVERWNEAVIRVAACLGDD